MSTWYVDTSAAAKLMLSEAESEHLAALLDSERPRLVSSYLLETELRRVVERAPGLTQADASEILDRVDLYEVPPSLFRGAGILPGAGLRSLDAVHCATAVQLGVDAVLCYDQRLADAARSCGLHIVAPSPG